MALQLDSQLNSFVMKMFGVPENELREEKKIERMVNENVQQLIPNDNNASTM